MLADRPLMQAFTSGVILTMALLLHALQLPFEAAEANRLETLSLCGSLMVLAFVGMAGADHTRQAIVTAHVTTIASGSDGGFAIDASDPSGSSDSDSPLVLSDASAWRSASVWLSLLAVAVNVAFFLSVLRTAWPHARTIIRNIRRNSILARQGSVPFGIGNKMNGAAGPDNGAQTNSQRLTPTEPSAAGASSTRDIQRARLPTGAGISSAPAPAFAVQSPGDSHDGHPLSAASPVFDSVDASTPAGSVIAPRQGARPAGGGIGGVGGGSFRLLYAAAPRRLRSTASPSASVLQSPSPLSPSLGHSDMQMTPLRLPTNAVRL